jgi:tetratricopeptide (TPR) repeat protein
MRVSSSQARTAAKFFLTLTGGVLLAYFLYFGYQKFGPSKIVLEGVSFGPPAGTVLVRGDVPNLEVGFDQLPFSTRDEVRRAFDLMLQGGSKQAIEIFDAILISYPELFMVEWGVLHVLWESDSLSSNELLRLEHLIRSVKKKATSASLDLYIDSREAYRLGSLPLALDLARKATEKGASFPDFRLWYGELLQEVNRLSQAIGETRVAIGLTKGTSQKAYENLALLYHQQGNLDSCTSVIEYALTKYPADTKLLLLQGYLSEYNGSFDMAEKNYQRILALNPNYKEAQAALNTLGEKSPPAHSSSARITPRDKAQLAYDILEPLVATYPENLPLREALGLAYLKGRSFDKAKQQFKEIQTKDPEYPEIQLRLQEASVTSLRSENDGALTESLNRVMDSIRTTMPSSKHDFSTMLGHYLVRYGASPKEFFTQYAVTNFKEIKKNTWQESFYEPPYYHQYTVLFSKTNQFYGVHVLVIDSSGNSNHLGSAPDIYNRLLKQNSRISGIGIGTGETDCNVTVIDAAVWETLDNFEILARYVSKPSEVRMMRLDKKQISDKMKLCDYLSYLNKY